MAAPRKTRKLNPIWAWLLVSGKIVVHALRYGGSKGAYINYTTGELIPKD